MLHHFFRAQLTLLSLFSIFPFWLLSVNPSPPPDSPDLGASVVQSQSFQGLQYSDCSSHSTPLINADFEQEVVFLVNTERALRGIPPLKRINQLDDASRYHAADMDQDNYFEHDSYDRANEDIYKVCDWFTRIDNFYQDWSWLGENIAIGYPTPSSVMTGWMNSPGHRENILSEEYWEIGVGYFSGVHWVQDFGKRPGRYPIIINNEAAKTDSPTVSIHLYGDTDTWDEIRLRNNDDPWSPWSVFQNYLSWQLPERAGEHMVTVEMRNKTTTSTSSDSIVLDIPIEAELGNIPDEIVFTYSIPDGRALPSIWQITPLNVINDAKINWEATTEGDWFSITPLAGTTPESLAISVSGTFTNTSIVHTGSVTISTISLGENACSDQLISLSLYIIDTPFETLFLPAVLRTSP